MRKTSTASTARHRCPPHGGRRGGRRHDGERTRARPPTSGQSNESASGGSGLPAPAVTETTATTSALTTAPAATPPAMPTRRDGQRAEQEVPAELGGRDALRLEVEELAALVAPVADDAEQDADGGERERRRRRRRAAARASRARAGRRAAAASVARLRRRRARRRERAARFAARRARSRSPSQSPARSCSPPRATSAGRRRRDRRRRTGSGARPPTTWPSIVWSSTWSGSSARRFRRRARVAGETTTGHGRALERLARPEDRVGGAVERRSAASFRRTRDAVRSPDPARRSAGRGAACRPTSR